MSVVVVATIHPIPEHRTEVVTALEQTIPRVHAADPGCELYALHEAEDCLVMIEKWATPEQLAAHSAGPLLAELQAAWAGKLATDLEVQVLQPHPAGTDSQGRL